MERVQIAHNSDLVLVVENRIELHVSSAVLCNTSSVFRAMLSSGWPEGQAFNCDDSSSPTQVNLHEDHGEGMKLLVAALHQRNDLLPERMDSVEVWLVAIMADRYNCGAAIQHTASVWLNSFPEENHNLYRLVAACSLYHAEAFAKIASTIVRFSAMHLPDFAEISDEARIYGIHDWLLRASNRAMESLQLKIGRIALKAARYMVPGHANPPQRYPNGNHVIASGCFARYDLAAKCIDKLCASGAWLS